MPVLLFAPYLTMIEPVEFGPWWLGPASSFDGAWHSDRFKELALQLLRAFRKPNGEPLDDPALLGHRELGVGGELPSEEELRAIQRALHFAVLDSNPDWQPGDGNEGLWMSTSDNSEVFAWPINLEDGRITITRGAMVRIHIYGYQISDDLVISAPEELWLPRPWPIDQETLAAIYEVLTAQNLGDREFASRIGLAIDWLALAWRNSPSVTFEQRVVMLKTAFEALTGQSRTYEAADWLDERFGKLAEAGANKWATEHLLWSPLEQKSRIWKQNANEEKCTDLGHWFRSFGRARNEIIHDGKAQSLTYEAEGSAYQGPYVNIAERVLRETIRVCLRDFGFHDLWVSPLYRKLKRAFEAAQC